MKWRVILAIAHKDILDAVKNRYILFSLLLPIGLSLLFLLVFPGPDDWDDLTVAVYDLGGSRLVNDLQASPYCQVMTVDSLQDLQKAVEKEAVGGLVLPVGFDAAVAEGARPELTVYINGRRGGGEMASFQRLVERQLWALAGHELPVHMVSIDVTDSEQTEKGFRVDRFLLIQFLVMAIALTGAFVVPTLLVEEKEKHTLDVLLMSPAGPVEVVAGKALTGLVYSLLIAGVLLTLNRGWAGAWPVTLLTVLLGTLFTVTLGLLMGGLFHTTMQVNTWSNLIMLTLLMPSWFIIVEVPAALETAFHLSPIYYLVEALNLSLSDQASLGQVWTHLAVLAGSVAVVFAAVVWTLRKQEQ